MLTYESEYISIFYHSQEAIVEGIWKDTTKRLKDEDFKLDMLEWLKVVQKYQPVNVLANTRDYQHTISPELQIWVNENILVFYLEAGVKKLAFVVPSDFFAQVSIEQTIQEQEQTFSAQYFDNEIKATTWLKQ